MKKFTLFLSILFSLSANAQLSYPIVDTGTKNYYNNSDIIEAPKNGEAFYGQDAHYQGKAPSYINNNDGTISDNITGLMWQQNMGNKITFAQAKEKADTLSLGGHNDWRIPTIKELYSLIQFTGQVKGATAISLFIDEDYFNQPLGNADLGEREIDAQTWSATHYRSTTMRGDSTIFGVNFVDGRIKGYPKYYPNSNNTNPRSMYFRLVRGNVDYGKNNFVDNGDGTVTDLATGLMWQQADDGTARDWQEALAYAENLTLGTHSDWRLPNAKELQSIVDYTRCPDITNSPAIDPIFSCTEIIDPSGTSGQYPYYWTSTTHLDGVNPYASAAYFAFGEAQGVMNNTLMDVHGAGCQRSDPKSGNKDNYPQFQGPQGDVRYVYNYTRCVRNTDISNTVSQIENKEIKIYPNPVVEGEPLYIKVNSAKLQEISIYNLDGKILHQLSKTPENKLIQIDTSAFEKGSFYIKSDKTFYRVLII